VIHKSGLLVAHETRRLTPGTDRDIMASMLTAIMNFMSISFAEGSDQLRRLASRRRPLASSSRDAQGMPPEDG